MPRPFVALAVGALVAVLLAGCGAGGGGSTTPTSGANATPTPTPSGVDLGVGAQVGNSGRAVGKISKGSAGNVTRQHLQGVTKGTAGTISHVSINSILSKKAVESNQQKQLAAQKAAERAAQRAAAQRAAAQRKSTHTTTTPAKPPTISNPVTVTVTVREKTPTPPAKSTVRTVTKTQTVVKTVNHTVTKTVPPNVPAGAFLPSKQPVLAQDSFTVPGSNVVCQITPGGITCGILRRVWAAPVQPASCKGSWGDTLALQRHGLAKFVCGGNNPLAVNAKVIPVGWDDQLDGFTCEVRSFGVNCFSPARSGFILSRTGYAFY